MGSGESGVPGTFSVAWARASGPPASAGLEPSFFQTQKNPSVTL